jgi:ATP-dependent Clp protease ATP-binding subunit ClpA
MMVGAGSTGQGGVDLAQMIKPVLTKGTVKVIASTTWEEYRKFFEKDRALMRRFQRVQMVRTTNETCVKILKVSNSTMKHSTVVPSQMKPARMCRVFR